jgi:hypothetical protein
MRLTKKVLLEMVSEAITNEEAMMQAAVDHLEGYLEDLNTSDDWEVVHADYVDSDINPVKDLAEKDKRYAEMYLEVFTISDETELKDHKLAVQLFKDAISRDMGKSPEEIKEVQIKKKEKTMNFTKKQIIKIIKEEIAAVMNEDNAKRFTKMPDELVNMINGLKGMEFEEGFEIFKNALHTMIRDPAGVIIASNEALLQAALLVYTGMDNLQLDDLDEYYDLHDILTSLGDESDNDNFMAASAAMTKPALKFLTLIKILHGKVNKELAGMENSDDNPHWVNQ